MRNIVIVLSVIALTFTLSLKAGLAGHNELQSPLLKAEGIAAR